MSQRQAQAQAQAQEKEENLCNSIKGCCHFCQEGQCRWRQIKGRPPNKIFKRISCLTFIWSFF